MTIKRAFACLLTLAAAFTGVANSAVDQTGTITLRTAGSSRYLAPEGTCRGDDNADGQAKQQLLAMRCLLDWARHERGLPPLRVSPLLDRSSALKAQSILRCGHFSHTPCRSDFSSLRTVAGARGGVGENLIWAASAARSPRTLVDIWLRSRGHRDNLFSTRWHAQGLALLRAASFQGEGPAVIAVHQFGS